MKKKLLTLAIATSLMSFSAANAQTFTYVSKTGDTKIIGGVGPSGTDYVGSHWTAKSTAKNADGSTTKSSSECVSMTQPPKGHIFDSHAACEVTSSTGTFSVVFGYTFLNLEASEMTCVGGMSGKTGEYTGKRGNVTLHSKDGSSTGTGQWFE